MYVRTRRHLPSSYPNRSQSLSLALSQDPQSIPIEFRKQSGLPFTSRSVNRVIDEYVALRCPTRTTTNARAHINPQAAPDHASCEILARVYQRSEHRKYRQQRAERLYADGYGDVPVAGAS